MKPDFDDVFYIVYEEMFKPKTTNYSWCSELPENVDYIHYYKIIPVYVKCVSDMYDGTTEFDITPVDIRDKKTKNWRWSRAVQDSDIGKTVFTSFEEAEKYFNKKYSETERKVFKEKEQYRKINGIN